MNKTPAQMIESAAERVLIAADSTLSIDDQAVRLIREESELIAELTPAWQLERVIRILREKRRELARKARERDQYLLPGFERLPVRIAIRDGKRRNLANATYRQLRDYLAVLHKRQQNNARVAQVKSLMELVHKYSVETPTITVREVCERENRGTKRVPPAA